MKKTIAIVLALLAGACSSAESPTATQPEGPAATLEVRSTEVEPLTLRLYGDERIPGAALDAMTRYFGTPPTGSGRKDLPDMSPGDRLVASVQLDDGQSAAEPWLIVVDADTVFDGVALRDRINNVFELAVSGQQKAEVRCAACEVTEGIACEEIDCPDGAR